MVATETGRGAEETLTLPNKDVTLSSQVFVMSRDPENCAELSLIITLLTLLSSNVLITQQVCQQVCQHQAGWEQSENSASDSFIYLADSQSSQAAFELINM